MWETLSGKAIVYKYRLGGKYNHTNRVSSVCFSSNGTFAVSESHDHTLRIWSIIDTWGDGKYTIKSSPPLIGHRDHVESVAVSPNGKFIVSGCTDSTFCIWDVSTRTIIYMSEKETYYHFVWFSSNGNDIISGNPWNNKISTTYMTSKEKLCNVLKHIEKLRCTKYINKSFSVSTNAESDLFLFVKNGVPDKQYLIYNKVSANCINH